MKGSDGIFGRVEGLCLRIVRRVGVIALVALLVGTVIHGGGRGGAFRTVGTAGTANTGGSGGGAGDQGKLGGNGGSGIVIVRYVMTPPNQAPVANAQSVSTDEDTAKAIMPGPSAVWTTQRYRWRSSGLKIERSKSLACNLLWMALVLSVKSEDPRCSL